MSPLHRAFSLVQVDDGPAGITEDLHLDVARMLQVLFHVQGSARERRLRPAGRGRERAREVARAVNARHADTAATARCLEDHRVPD